MTIKNQTQNAYHRKKNPERVKKLIIENAMGLAAEHGVNGVSIQAVATLSGVTKGGVFHHFANKQLLIEAMLEELIQQLDDQISLMMEKDPVQYGRFTRAYIDVTLSSEFGVDTLWSALSMTVMTDKSFSKKWDRWLKQRLLKHSDTDHAIELNILRYAADGVWFVESLAPEIQDDYMDLKKELLARTYLKDE
ncbi:MAG: HTH-type transcriptional repressor AcnR [Acinetobacter bereziniae]|uniref:HTH-type transcriptional repressor AcnR n=1 Tax=Acinetobacter bereziniae TaxID=106648 RepID=A0A833PFG1_ACIBZ|nr:MAG: HTH-type transcriptional repressor AcnR [Acinetobacter bereziniae]